MRHFAILLAASSLVAGPACAKKKKKKDEPPPVGWYQEEGWPGECYFPKPYDDLGPGDRKLARSAAMTALMEGWGGGRGNPKFDSESATYFETIMLGESEIAEAVSIKNAAFCRKYMEADEESRSDSEWKRWFKSEPERLTEGDCPHAPLVDTVYQYLDIDKGWQFKWGVCAGDKVKITGSAIDEYVLEKGGDWMNVEGNGVKAVAEQYDCNLEGCYEGQLIMRWTGLDGIITVTPIGAEHDWVAPDHGHIEVKINDLTWDDNEFRQRGQLIDHTQITYAGQ